MAGHSSQTNAEMLGIRAGFEIHVAGEPAEYKTLVGELPEGVRIASQLDESTDLAHLFVTRRIELAMALQIYCKKLSPGATVWVSWPGKTVDSETDISAAIVRDLASSLGYTETRTVQITPQWSGICFSVPAA